MSAPLPVYSFDLANFGKRIVIAGIKGARADATEMKQRIMIARQCGFLSDDETEDWIAMAGLQSA